jgi:sarcosine oxidase subunit delta
MKKGWAHSPICTDMIINHPILGPRDASEFTYLGDASLLNRPDWQAPDADQQFVDYLYLRDNPAGELRELWFHELGDRSWLVVTRNTLTHEISNVEFASDVARAKGGNS